MENTNVQMLDGRTAGRECKIATSRCHVGLIVYLIAVSIVASVASFFLGIFGSFNPDAYMSILSNPLYSSILVWGLQILAMYIIGYPIFHLMTRYIPKRDISKKEKLGSLELLKLAIASQGIIFIGSMVAGFVTDFINAKLGIVVEDSTSELIGSTNILIVILVVVIIGPIFEELIFRKAFVDIIGKYNIRLAVFISAASFALFHGNITQAIYTFAVGLILGWVYAKTKNIFYKIFLHIFINFFGSVPSLLIMDSYERLQGMTEEELSSITDPAILMDVAKVGAYSLMTYGFIFIGGLLFLSMLFKGYFKLPRDGEVKIPFFKKLGILFFNRGTIIFVIYSILSIVANLFMPLIEQYLENYLV